MATRERRLGEFNTSAPPPGEAVQVLCEDHNGTYLLPYLCTWRDGGWRNAGSGEPIEAEVVGWREPATAPTSRYSGRGGGSSR